MNTYHLIWSPEGRCIATVQAMNERAAIRKAPKPYRKYLGEIYAEEVFNCEICGEPAGAGGALCPVHLREAGIE